MRRRRKQESGFALLLVFALAAAIAISLYTQLPRAAFESQRNKEELLIERGEQYKRGIQLFVTKNKRFPASLDELEKMGEIRYLRKRYVDPMTGKDEWRAIHVNAAGMLTDSILQKGKEEKKENLNTFVSEGPGIGGTPNNGETPGVNMALRRRPSDQAPNVDPNAPPPPPPPPGEVNAQQAGLQPGQPFPQPGQPFPQPGQPFNPNQPNQQQPSPQQTGQQPGQPGYPNNAATDPNRGYGTVGSGYNQQPQQQQGQGQTPQPGQPGAGAPGNPALDLIGKILTSPRQQFGNPAATRGGQQIGAGIAGFASKVEMPSIKIYNDRQKYNEWEFVYDMKKDKRIMPNVPGMNAQPQGQQNPNGNQNQIGTGFGGGFGQNSSSTPNTSGFGTGLGQPQNQNQNQPNPGQGSTGGSGSFITPSASIGSTGSSTGGSTATNPNQNQNPNQNPNQPQPPNQFPGAGPQQPPRPRNGPF